MQEARGRENIAPNSFSISELNGVSGQRHTPAALYPRERTPGSRWIEGMVGLGAGLDTEDRENPFSSAGDRNPFVQAVGYSNTTLTELPQLPFTIECVYNYVRRSSARTIEVLLIHVPTI
jgi:hypothetical protein